MISDGVCRPVSAMISRYGKSAFGQRSSTHRPAAVPVAGVIWTPNDHWHLEFLGQRFDAIRDVRNLLLPVLSATRSRMKQLQVVNDEKLDSILLVHAPGFGPKLENGQAG